MLHELTTQVKVKPPERRGNWSAFDADTPGKIDQRKRILRHMLDNQNHLSCGRLLTMPGEHWSFENDFAREKPEFSFTGLDWNWSVIEKSIGFMPIAKSRTRDVAARGYRGLVDKAPIYREWDLAIGTLRGYESGRALFLHAHASVFLSLGRSAVSGIAKFGTLVDAGKRRQQEWFARQFKTNTGIWLDFTSPLCSETESAIKRVGYFCSRAVYEVPVAVSLMMGHDAFADAADPVGPRAIRVVQLLNDNQYRQFIPCDAWSYAGIKNTPMLTVTGLMRSREKARIRERAKAGGA